MQRAYDTAHPSPASPVGKVLRGFMYVGGYVAAAGLLLAFGRRGDPIWADGQLLLIAGGIPFLAYGAWAYTTRTTMPRSTIPEQQAALAVAGLAALVIAATEFI